MDKNVPPGAAILLDFIGGIEAPQGYGTIYGNNQGKLPKPLTAMTVDEVIGAGPGWTRVFGSSAAGRYQFMNATLKGLKKELGLRGTQLLDANLQDRLAFHLLEGRGYDAFMAGTLPAVIFGKQLAQEWASLPVLAATKGGSRNVTRGQSYYAGDGLNKSLVAPETVEAVLVKAKGAHGAPAYPKPVPQAPPSEPKRGGVSPTVAIIAFIVLVAAILVAFFVRF